MTSPFISITHRKTSKLKAFVCELTFLNVLGQDPYIFVSIRADLLVVEAQSVKHLMLHRGGVHTTSFLQRDLLSTRLLTNVGPTSDMHTVKK